MIILRNKKVLTEKMNVARNIVKYIPKTKTLNLLEEINANER